LAFLLLTFPNLRVFSEPPLQPHNKVVNSQN
jgi:hypothetical protein